MSTVTTPNQHIRRQAQTASIERDAQGPNSSTLSATKDANGLQHQRRKILTNFSIESIIGRTDGNEELSTNHGLKNKHQNTSTKIESAHCPNGCELNGKERNGQAATRAERVQLVSNNQSKRHALEIRKYRPKNYQCPICCMAFSNNGQLKNHVRIHTGERPFRCNQSNCGKTFTRNEELTRHKLIHTGVRPHACPSCPKSFGRKDHLKKHVKTHERKKPRKGYFVAPTRRTNSMDAANRDKLLLLSPSKEKDNFKISSAPNELNSLTSMSSFMTPFSLPSDAQYIPYNDSKAFLSLSLAQPPLLPPVTFAPTRLPLDSTIRTMDAATVRSTQLNMQKTTITTSSEPLQQLAGDYWQKWYNLLGLYQS